MKISEPTFQSAHHEAILHPVSPSTFSWCQIMAADKYFWQGDTPRSRDFPITGEPREHSGWPVQDVIWLSFNHYNRNRSALISTGWWELNLYYNTNSIYFSLHQWQMFITIWKVCVKCLVNDQISVTYTVLLSVIQSTNKQYWKMPLNQTETLTNRQTPPLVSLPT